jgi:hypothetical protein
MPETQGFNITHYRDRRKLCIDISILGLSEVSIAERELRGLFEKLVNWQQCTVVMQREALTVMPSCSGGSAPLLCRGKQ